MSDLTLPDMICFALYSANHAMQRVYQPLLSPLGLTYPQFLVLMTLWQADDRTVGDLGRALGLDSNTLTPLLKRMETQGLLARARGKKDERQVRVTLTDKGAALKDQASGLSTCIFDACGLEPEALTTLREQITALRDRLAG